MRWAGHVDRMGRGEVHTEFWCGNLREGDHFEDPGIDGRIILRWIFRTWSGGHGMDPSGSGLGHVAGSCECGNETSNSVKCGEFID